MNNNHSLKYLLQQANKFWGSIEKSKEWDPIGLISPYFPTQFNPSASHHQIYEILNRNVLPPFQEIRYVTEKVFRVSDVQLVGDQTHLSIFRMFGVVKFLKPTKDYIPINETRLFLEHIFNFLKTIGIVNLDKFYITIFAGGYINGQYFPPEEHLVDIFKSLGIKENQIIPLSGTSQFLFPSIENDLAGPRCDLYIKDEKTGIFIEISTIDTLPFIRKEGKVRRNDNFYLLGFYFGVERLLSILNGSFDVWKIEPLYSLLERFSSILFQNKPDKYLIINTLFSTILKQLVDKATAILFITNAGQKIDSSSRGRILRNIVKDFIRMLMDLCGDFDFNLLKKIFDLTSDAYLLTTEDKLDSQLTLQVIKNYLHTKNRET